MDVSQTVIVRSRNVVVIHDVLMDTVINESILYSTSLVILSYILPYYCYRYTSGNVDDTVILLDDAITLLLLKI